MPTVKWEFNIGDYVTFNGKVGKVLDRNESMSGNKYYDVIFINGDRLPNINECNLEKYEYTKDKLALMDIVKFRDGRMQILLNNTNSSDNKGFFNNSGSCSHYLDRYDDALCLTEFGWGDKTGRDIVAVYHPVGGAQQSEALKNFYSGVEPKYWTWERVVINAPKVKEISLNDAVQQLKEKYPDFDEVKILV